MKPADLARLRVPGQPSVSADGRLAAVAVSRLDLTADQYCSQVLVVPTDGSARPRAYTRGPRDTAPVFSPDGRWLAFLRAEQPGRPQPYLMPADGGEPFPVCAHPLGVSGLVWRPDSAVLGYLARVPELGRYGDVPPEKEPPRRITVFRYRLDDVGFTLDRRAHVFVVDPFAERPEPVQVTAGDFDDADPSWSPDGSLIAFVSSRHDGRDVDLAADVFVVPAAGGDPRRVTRTTTTVARPAFSPDGATLYYLGTDRLDVAGRTTGLWSVPVDGSAPPRRLTDAEHYDLADRTDAPLLVDEGGVAVGVLRRGAVYLVRFPAEGTGKPRRLVAGRRQVRGYARPPTGPPPPAPTGPPPPAPPGRPLVVTLADATSAGELVAICRGRERVLSDFGGELARSTPLRPLEELTAAAPDGVEVHGWLVRPAGTGPFPVLLVIHGGPFSQHGYALFDEAQVYAGADYAVVLGNPRGSAGYGEAHGRSVVGDIGGADSDDLLALLDAALEDPDVDETRVGVMGGSYGGLMATWLVAHTNRFRAAISERAVNAWDSFSGSSDIGWWFARAYTGLDPARTAAQSPLSFADRITTPMLILHSEQDWRCPLEQAQRLYVQLKSQGVETELLLFPGEGHELSRSGLPSHRVARLEAILQWWARHLDAPSRRRLTT